MASEKIRLDKLLVERGIAMTREKARALILAKAVKINEIHVDKADTLVPSDAQVHVKGEDNPYVSRGGLKLKGALELFGLDVEGLVAFDVGASTGGFTDCLLQAGAAKVYALDVNYGQLAWKLRQDERVVNLEKTNIRYLTPDKLPHIPDLAVIDASFISLAKVLPATLILLKDEAVIIALIKPQFEVGRGEVGKGGVVRDAMKHREVITAISSVAENLGLKVRGVTESPILGPKGNREFLIFMVKVAGTP